MIVLTNKQRSILRFLLRLTRGTVLFSHGYFIGVIGTVITLLTRENPGGQFGTQYHSTLLASMAFVGIIFGMLLGILLLNGSRMGMMGAPFPIIFFSIISSSVVFMKGQKGESVGEFVTTLCAFCAVLGFFVGVFHTSGSAFHSEMEQDGIAKNARYQWLVLGTKTMIDAGFVLAAFAPLALYWIHGEQHLDKICGLSLAFCIIPGCVLLCECGVFLYYMAPLRQYLPDTSNPSEFVPIPMWLTLKWYWKSVLGLSLAWFIYDFVMYPFCIYSSMTINNITGGSSSLSIVLGWSVVTNLLCIPGTVLGAFLVDYLGVKTSMIVGLLLQAIVGFTMGTMYSPLTNHISTFAVVYGIFLSFGEVGPGSCLRVLAVKTALMSCVNGQIYNIAAAIGKVGAFIGMWVFPEVIDGYVHPAFGGSKTMKGIISLFWIGGGLAILNAVVTFFLVKPLTYDSMKAEDKAFHQYLEENGVDVSHMHDVFDP